MSWHMLGTVNLGNGRLLDVKVLERSDEEELTASNDSLEVDIDVSLGGRRAAQFFYHTKHNTASSIGGDGRADGTLLLPQSQVTTPDYREALSIPPPRIPKSLLPISGSDASKSSRVPIEVTDAVRMKVSNENSRPSSTDVEMVVEEEIAPAARKNTKRKQLLPRSLSDDEDQELDMLVTEGPIDLVVPLAQQGHQHSSPRQKSQTEVADKSAMAASHLLRRSMRKRKTGVENNPDTFGGPRGTKHAVDGPDHQEGDVPSHSKNNAAKTGGGNLQLWMAAFPAEVLARIFRALPWPDRVRIERVCKMWRTVVLASGWSNLHYFDEGEVTSIISTLDYARVRSALLERIGTQLTGLNLVDSWREVTTVGVGGLGLHADLARCPSLKHLGLKRKLLDIHATITIRRTHAPTLKSLSLVDISPMPNFYQLSYLFNHSGIGADQQSEPFVALEYLRICQHQAVHLSLPAATTLPCLYHVSIEFDNGDLSAEDLSVLASLPSLRSLTLKSWTRYHQLFSHLNHLCLYLCEQSVKRFIWALPSMAAMRALELHVARIPKYERVTLGSLMIAVANHLYSNLEHFGLFTEAGVVISVGCLDGGRMERLSSLELDCSLPRQESGGGATSWRWLESMHRLEYLRLRKAPPIATTCQLVKKCKKLRVLDFDNYRLAKKDRVALLQAVASNDDGGQRGGQRRGNGTNQPLDLLQVRMEEGIITTVGSRCTHKAASAPPRVRFVASNVPLPSHVLNRHKYGGLSEGPPPFAE